MVYFSPPKSDSQKIIIPPDGKKFITGLAYHYKEFFPTELESLIEFDDYYRIVSDINDVVKTYWPCLFSLFIGYFFCPFTLGLSLLIPSICIRDAETEVNRILKYANRDVFQPRGMNMQFRKGWFTSWIQIDLPDTSFSAQKYSHGTGVEMA